MSVTRTFSKLSTVDRSVGFKRGISYLCYDADAMLKDLKKKIKIVKLEKAPVPTPTIIHMDHIVWLEDDDEDEKEKKDYSVVPISIDMTIPLVDPLPFSIFQIPVQVPVPTIPLVDPLPFSIFQFPVQVPVPTIPLVDPIPFSIFQIPVQVPVPTIPSVDPLPFSSTVPVSLDMTVSIVPCTDIVKVDKDNFPTVPCTDIVKVDKDNVPTVPCTEIDEIDTTVPIKTQYQNLRIIDKELLSSKIELRHVKYELGIVKFELAKLRREVNLRSVKQRNSIVAHKKELQQLSKEKQRIL